MASPQIFGINGPDDLYRLLTETYSEYQNEPTERGFLFLCFGLHHLREWILGTGEFTSVAYKRITPLPAEDRKPEEQFYLDIGELDEFEIIQNFSNSGKHGTIKKPIPQTTVEDGFMFEISSFGDGFGQVNFVIGSKNSRDIFEKVIQVYKIWFDGM